MNFFQTALTLFMTFASIGQTQGVVNTGNGGNAGTSAVESGKNQSNGNGINISTNGIILTFGNNEISGNANGAGDGCPGCTPAGPGS